MEYYLLPSRLHPKHTAPFQGTLFNPCLNVHQINISFVHIQEIIRDSSEHVV